MAVRANWKGMLRIAEIQCPVALYTAASTSERIAFHLLNRKTGNRVHREFVDEASGKPVAAEDQVKGYEIDTDRYIVLTPEEIAAAVPESDKVLDVACFVRQDEVDDAFFDKPYYLSPSDRSGDDAFAVIREGLRQNGVAALAQTVLFRRIRTVLIRPRDDGLIAHTLHFDYEVRAAKEIFADIAVRKIDPEMLDLARHIIETKRGSFDPKTFDDRYDAALAEMVRAKQAGEPLPQRPEPEETKIVDLMEALRRSAGGDAAAAKPSQTKRAKGSGATARKKAG